MVEPLPSCDAGEHKPQPPSYSDTAVERASGLFRAMGDPPRLRILAMLSPRECCVTEIVETLKEKFSTVSQRLRVLRTERLIVRRRKGTHIFYALADRHVADLIHNALEHAAELEAGSGATEEQGD